MEFLDLLKLPKDDTHPKVKHICNSHKPTLYPKIAKELALPTLTLPTLKN
jgi:hypothetical protein